MWGRVVGLIPSSMGVRRVSVGQGEDLRTRALPAKVQRLSCEESFPRVTCRSGLSSETQSSCLVGQMTIFIGLPTNRAKTQRIEPFLLDCVGSLAVELAGKGENNLISLPDRPDGFAI